MKNKGEEMKPRSVRQCKKDNKKLRFVTVKNREVTLENLVEDLKKGKVACRSISDYYELKMDIGTGMYKAKKEYLNALALVEKNPTRAHDRLRVAIRTFDMFFCSLSFFEKYGKLINAIILFSQFFKGIYMDENSKSPIFSL